MEIDAKRELEKRAHINRWFVISRNMAKSRGEVWCITFEEFFDIWNTDDRWLYRGRRSNDYNLSRIDMAGEWHTQNVEVITRKEMLQREARYKKEKN